MAEIHIVRNTLTYRDLRGHTGKVSFYVQYDRTVTNSLADATSLCVTLIADISVLTNGTLVASEGLAGNVFPPNAYGLAAVYANAETKARLRMLAVDNTIHSLSIPAPVLSMFEADQETVLGSAISTLVTHLTAAPIAASFACTRAGSPFAASLGGGLVRRKFQRKLNIYDKSANLDEPEE